MIQLSSESQVTPEHLESQPVAAKKEKKYRKLVYKSKYILINGFKKKEKDRRYLPSINPDPPEQSLDAQPRHVLVAESNFGVCPVQLDADGGSSQHSFKLQPNFGLNLTVVVVSIVVSTTLPEPYPPTTCDSVHVIVL